MILLMFVLIGMLIGFFGIVANDCHASGFGVGFGIATLLIIYIDQYLENKDGDKE